MGAVDEQDVVVPVAVVVEEGAAAAHGLRHPLVPGGAGFVGELDAGFRGDVGEADLRRLFPFAYGGVVGRRIGAGVRRRGSGLLGLLFTAG